jgi:enoyl-CoA hydratase
VPEPPVLYEAADRVATLTLNRPERLNTIVPALIDAFDEALARANADPEVHAIRLRGAGRTFCAGYDIDWGAEMMEAAESGGPWDPILDYQTMSRYVRSYMSLWRSPKPVIAQVHGFCVGGGTDFALCSDLIVCSGECRIAWTSGSAFARASASSNASISAGTIVLSRSGRLSVSVATRSLAS